MEGTAHPQVTDTATAHARLKTNVTDDELKRFSADGSRQIHTPEDHTL